MNTERPEPRSAFTFFPHNNEEQRVASASADELVDVILHEPDLTIQFLHELWRTGRSADVRAIGERIGGQLIDIHYSYVKMALCTSLLSQNGHDTDEEIEAFIFETNVQFIGGIVSKNDEDEEFMNAMRGVTDNMMEYYKAMNLEYSTRFN